MEIVPLEMAEVPAPGQGNPLDTEDVCQTAGEGRGERGERRAGEMCLFLEKCQGRIRMVAP